MNDHETTGAPKSGAVMANEVLYSGHVHLRSDADGSVAVAEQAEVRFSPVSGGDAVVSRTNETGAYLAMLPIGDYDVEVVDKQPYSSYSTGKMQISAMRGNSPVQREHFVLAESCSMPHEAIGVAYVADQNWSPIGGATVTWCRCEDDVAIATEVTTPDGSASSMFLPGDYYAVATKDGSTSDPSPCQTYPDHVASLAMLILNL